MPDTDTHTTTIVLDGEPEPWDRAYWQEWAAKQRATLHEAGFDPAEHPREPAGSPEGGQFAPKHGGGDWGTPGEAKILEGFNSGRSKTNALRIRNKIEHSLDGRTGADRPTEAVIEERLRRATRLFAELPLVHVTKAEAAIEIYRDGLRSHAEVVAETEELVAELEKLQDVGRLTGKQAEQLSDLQDALVGTGTTFDADRALGLDRFAFMSFGRPMGIYGGVTVCIDQAVLDDEDTFATPSDILYYDNSAVAASAAKAKGGRYSPEVVEAYRDEMVRGATTIRDLSAQWVARSHWFAESPDPAIVLQLEHGFEVKAARVPPSAIKGFLVTEGSREEADLKKAGIPTGKIFLLPKGLMTADNEAVAQTALLRRIQTGKPVAVPDLPHDTAQWTLDPDAPNARRLLHDQLTRA